MTHIHSSAQPLHVKQAMINQDLKNRSIFRIQSIITNLNSCVNGSHVHEINAMKHTAQLLLDAISDAKCSDLDITGMIKRLETRQYDFFAKLFGKSDQ